MTDSTRASRAPAPRRLQAVSDRPWWELLLVLALGSACIAGLLLVAHLGDYPQDAGPAVAALAAGSFRRAAAVPFLMGPFSVLLRAPFAWAADRAGLGQLDVYRAGLLPCLAAAGALGVALMRPAAGRSGDRSSWPLLVPILAILTPASVAAVQIGHPEEALGGALSAAAVLLAVGRRAGWAGIALGLAVATKQWALIAVVPTLLAVPASARLRLAIVGGVTAAVFYVPFIAANPHAFLSATHMEAHVISVATPATIWLLASHGRQIPVEGSHIVVSHAIAGWIPPFSHALIILVALPLAVALWRRPIEKGAPLALLAFLFLIRCVLDPVDLEYNHLPFVLALLAWEARAGRVLKGVPVVTVGVVVCLWVTFTVLIDHRVDVWLCCGVYLAWTSAVGVYLLGAARLLPTTLLSTGQVRSDIRSE